MSGRWWTAAALLATLAAILTFVGPQPWMDDWPAWARAILNAAIVLLWVWFLEAVVSSLRRLAQRQH